MKQSVEMKRDVERILLGFRILDAVMPNLVKHQLYKSGAKPWNGEQGDELNCLLIQVYKYIRRYEHRR